MVFVDSLTNTNLIHSYFSLPFFFFRDLRDGCGVSASHLVRVISHLSLLHTLVAFYQVLEVTNNKQPALDMNRISKLAPSPHVLHYYTSYRFQSHGRCCNIFILNLLSGNSASISSLMSNPLIGVPIEVMGLMLGQFLDEDRHNPSLRRRILQDKNLKASIR